MISLSSAPLLVTAFALLTNCSSSSDGNAENGGETQRGQAGNPSAGASEGGASNTNSDAGEGGAAAGEGGATVGEGGATVGEGGAEDSSGGTSAGGAHAGSSSAGAGAGGTVTTNPTSSPCSYSVSGGKTFPEGDAIYICTINSRVYQQGGKGTFNALIGAGFSTAAGDTSTFACNMDSASAPKAGDTWTMGTPDHPGNCELAFSQNQVATLWHAGTSPTTGEFSIKFNSVTLKNGMYQPEDVYYLYDLTITAKLKGLTDGATDVTATGSFVNMSLPLGG